MAAGLVMDITDADTMKLRFPKSIRPALALSTCFLAFSCSKLNENSESHIAFCTLGFSPNSHDADPLYFDVEKKIAYSSELRSQLVWHKENGYTGILMPFAIMIPTPEVLRMQGSHKWTVGAYRFSIEASKTSPDPDLFLIRTEPSADDAQITYESPRVTTTLYSRKHGIIFIRELVEINGQQFENDLYRCSKKEFHLDML
jgi:hypothetical protein